MPALTCLKQLHLPFFAATAMLIFVTVIGSAYAADSPFIDQIPSGLADLPNHPSESYGLRSFGPAAAQWLSPKVLPNLASSLHASASKPLPTNLAATIEIGRSNNVVQFQNGIGNESAVGVIGGNANNVFVGQTGNDLRSNLLLIGTNGMNVGVLQPNGSAPVDMAIIRARAGTVIIPR